MLDTEYDDLRQEKHDLAKREKEMQRDALRVLQHHAWKHAMRLCFAGLGFKIAPDPEPEYQDIQDEPVTA